jgi:pimeloyl-ACP methyl ester carboxylesterase
LEVSVGKSKTIVFVHGMFMTPLCWEHWVGKFTSLGYRCLAPAWPGRDRPIADLRANHPDAELGKLTLSDVVEHYAAAVSALDEKPVVVGHSMGGLVTQLLLSRDLASAGVAIDSAPPAGVFTRKGSFLKANWAMVNPFVSKTTPHSMSFSEFQYAFVNGRPEEEQRTAYDRYVVPESRQVPRDTAKKVDFARPHAPLLMIAGERDHIIPASLNQANHKKYTDASSVTDFREFPDRTHFIIAQPGWEEVADHVAGWLAQR